MVQIHSVLAKAFCVADASFGLIFLVLVLSALITSIMVMSFKDRLTYAFNFY